MSFSLQKLLRPHILTIKPYSSARDEYSGHFGVFLDANENPIGSVGLPQEDYNRYPDPYQQDIKKKLSVLKNIDPSQIFLGNGSDEAIDLLMRACCIPGKDNVVILPPTYGMYEVSAAINDVELIKVNLTPDYQISPQAVLDAVNEHSKLLFICSPNNPSGNKLNREDINHLLHHFSGLVVVDEAYIDFSDEPSFIEELEKYPNLLVLQTFSKAWGMASLRVGMAFASKEIIQVLQLIKPPYNISGLTQSKVLQALENADELPILVSEIIQEREFLINQFNKLSVVQKVFPTQANFVLIKVVNAKDLYEYLISRQIIVRDRSKVVLCDESLRITVGTREENEALITALKAY
jgi:histidinol-phosphate aminotransferase